MTINNKKMNITRMQTIRALLWKLFERGGNAIAQVVIQICLARLLSPNQFGMLSIMLVFVNLGNVIVQSGMNTGLIQTPKLSRIDCSTVFWMSFAISLVLYVLLFLCAPTIADFYSMNELVWPLRILGLLLIINSYNSIQISLVTRNLETRKLFVATIISSSISALLGIGCALSDWGVWALVIQQLSYQLTNCLALAVQLSWRPRLIFSISSAKRLFGFGSRLLISGLLDQGYQSLSDLVIGRQFSAEILGFVSQGKKYPQAIGNILDGAIQPVMLSAVARAQDNTLLVKSLVRRALKTSTFLIIPAMSLFALIAPTLVPILLGDQWSDTVWFMQVYCVVYAMLPIHTANLQALNGMGRSDLFLRLELVKKTYGITWIVFSAIVVGDVRFMVAGYLVTGLLSTAVNAWPNKKVIGYSYEEQIKDILPAIGLTIVSLSAGAAITLLPVSGLALIIIQIGAFVGVYIATAFLFRVEELTYLVETLEEMLLKR